MAKRKKSTRSRKQKAAPEHKLPAGFWAQVGAVLMMAASVLLVVAWFGAGGPVLDWVNQSAVGAIGYAVYVLPLLFIFAAVEVFRSKNNRLPFVMKLGTILLVVWFAGLFGLMHDQAGNTNGGFIGGSANNTMLAFVNPAVAAFIYVLFIAVTTLFVLRLSPFAVISRAWDIIKPGLSEQEANVTVMRKAAEAEPMRPAPVGDLKLNLNAGVPTLDHEVSHKPVRSSGLKGSAPPDKAAEEQAALVTVSDPNWQAPSLDLLEKKQSPTDAGDIQQNAKTIRDTLAEFNIEVEMEGANIGPKVTQYTLRPPSGVKLSRISALDTNLALNLAASTIRIEAPIPGQRAVGIEVPNRKAADVRLYGILTSKAWKQAREPLAFAVGKDVSGDPVVAALDKMPHLLIAGQTGSGKSVMIDTLLTSLMFRNAPSDMKLILIDPKVVSMTRYDGVPHLLAPIITDTEKTVSALKWAVNEMERRLKLFAEDKLVDIKSYNEFIRSSRKKITVKDEDGFDQRVEEGAMPYIVIVIDEMSDLMLQAGKDLEALIVRLAQKARAAGIHLVLATQSPRADVITGLIKANVPSRIAFTVSNQLESRIILDQNGAEKLLGQGDMLLSITGMSKAKRVQGAWVTEDEVRKITNHLCMQAQPQYNDEIISQPVHLKGKGGVVMAGFDGGGEDEMFKEAVRLAIETGTISTSSLGRRLRLGYNRSARIIDEMEERGIIGPKDGSRPREVLISSLDDLASE